MEEYRYGGTESLAQIKKCKWIREGWDDQNKLQTFKKKSC